jgi:hypothetical protein
MAARKDKDKAKEAALAAERKAARAAFKANPENMKAFREQNPEAAEMYRVERNAARRVFYDTHTEQERARAKTYYEPTGKVKGYMHEDGSITRMKSMPEVYFASYLDDMGMDYSYEPVTFKTPYGDYTPDFYLPAYNLFIEVKGKGVLIKYPEASAKQKVKRDYLRTQGVDVAMMDAGMIEKQVGY